jgi:hypothetical protein
VTTAPEHVYRRAEMVLWLESMRQNIAEQAPPSVPKERSLRLIDGWLEDLPTCALLRQ